MSDNIAILSSIYNEEGCIQEFIGKLKIYHDEDHLFFIDDRSTDNSLNILKQMVDEKHIFANVHNLGQGASLTHNLLNLRDLGYEYVITMDSDLQHDPEDLQSFNEILSENKSVDIIVGSRYLKDSKIVGNQPFSRFLVNQLFCHLFQALYDEEISDCFSGYLLFNLQNADKLVINNPGYSWVITFWHKVFENKLKFTECPISRIYLDNHRNFKNFYKRSIQIAEELFHAFFVEFNNPIKKEELVNISQKHFVENEEEYARSGIYLEEIIEVISQKSKQS